MSELSQLRSPAAVQAALDEFTELGRTAFLERYGYGKSRDFLVRNPRNGELCDSKAIAGVAYGKQFPERGPLKPSDFSGGEATVAPRLQALGYEVVRIGEDWSPEEVSATVADYFEMLTFEARQQSYNKAAHNAALRARLRGRSKSSVELKHQNISAVLAELGLPFIPGYKPRSNVQLLLRKAVQAFVLKHPDTLLQIVDAFEEVKTPGEKTYRAVLVDPPSVAIVKVAAEEKRVRVPRRIDFAARDESNRRLGRAGEQWVLGYEQQRLNEAGCSELFGRVDWVSDRLGDGAGYDILSFEDRERERYIEVKTTNGGPTSSFIVTRNELQFSCEAGEQFWLYRVFAFRESPRLFMLQGNLSRHVHLEAMDYRASFNRTML